MPDLANAGILGPGYFDAVLETGLAEESTPPAPSAQLPDTPGRKLVLAILEDALRTYARAPNARRESREARAEVVDWLHSDDQHAFSFRWVCDVLGLDAGWIRAHLPDARYVRHSRLIHAADAVQLSATRDRRAYQRMKARESRARKRGVR